MKRFIALSFIFVGCGDPGDGSMNEQEVISRVELTFMPPSGSPVTFTFDDPDGDGGAAGTAQPITLNTATTYALSISFLNSLETPPEDITPEVRDEGVEHQVFLTGTAVNGPASNSTGPLTHTYADTDANGLPLGLENTIATIDGTGQLIVTLRHMPPELPPGKGADTASQVAASGFSAIGGSTDAQVTFDVTVQ